MAVGGVTPENAVNFYRLGYKGVAAGSNLVPKHAKRSDLKRSEKQRESMWRCPKYEQSSKRYDMAGSAGAVT